MPVTLPQREREYYWPWCYTCNKCKLNAVRIRRQIFFLHTNPNFGSESLTLWRRRITTRCSSTIGNGTLWKWTHLNRRSRRRITSISIIWKRWKCNVFIGRRLLHRWILCWRWPLLTSGWTIWKRWKSCSCINCSSRWWIHFGRSSGIRMIRRWVKNSTSW